MESPYENVLSRSIMVFNRGKLVGAVFDRPPYNAQINGIYRRPVWASTARPYRPPMYVICTGRDCLKTLKN